ncbi:MAG: hypothetical protein ACREYE_27475 [Gammaproteobacteria bacterium]
MSETIAITGKSVKLFKGHYTRSYLDRAHRAQARGYLGALAPGVDGSARQGGEGVQRRGRQQRADGREARALEPNGRQGGQDQAANLATRGKRLTER